jgi:hypothetical protein
LEQAAILRIAVVGGKNAVERGTHTIELGGA